MKKLNIISSLVVFLFSINVFSQCDTISLIGEFTGWAADSVMIPDESDPANSILYISFSEEDDTDENGVVEVKFRSNFNWIHNWGSLDFPSGIGEPDGANIPVPLGNYIVNFNCESYKYDFAINVNTPEEDAKSLKIYPVPAQNNLYLKNTGKFIRIDIYSLIGQKIGTVINDGKENLELNLNAYNEGIFFLKLYTTEGFSETRRFIKN